MILYKEIDVIKGVLEKSNDLLCTALEIYRLMVIQKFKPSFQLITNDFEINKTLTLFYISYN